MNQLLIKLIDIYQKTLSPDTGWFKSRYPGGYCKFTPSCSQYCKDSIQKHGAGKGSILGIYRILRCNPWNKGGYDPI
jgi:uncharacterized protein